MYESSSSSVNSKLEKYSALCMSRNVLCAQIVFPGAVGSSRPNENLHPLLLLNTPIL